MFLIFGELMVTESKASEGNPFQFFSRRVFLASVASGSIAVCAWVFGKRSLLVGQKNKSVSLTGPFVARKPISLRRFSASDIVTPINCRIKFLRPGQVTVAVLFRFRGPVRAENRVSVGASLFDAKDIEIGAAAMTCGDGRVLPQKGETTDSMFSNVVPVNIATLDIPVSLEVRSLEDVRRVELSFRRTA